MRICLCFSCEDISAWRRAKKETLQKEQLIGSQQRLLCTSLQIWTHTCISVWMPWTCFVLNGLFIMPIRARNYQHNVSSLRCSWNRQHMIAGLYMQHQDNLSSSVSSYAQVLECRGSPWSRCFAQCFVQMRAQKQLESLCVSVMM